MSRAIKRLEALLTEADPGNWQVDGVSEDVVVDVGPTGRHWVTGGGGNPSEGRLIAAAVNALPALLRVAKSAKFVVAYDCWMDVDFESRMDVLRKSLTELERVK